MLALSNAASGSPWAPILGDDGEGSREEGKGKVEGGGWNVERGEERGSIVHFPEEDSGGYPKGAGLYRPIIDTAPDNSDPNGEPSPVG